MSRPARLRPDLHTQRSRVQDNGLGRGGHAGEEMGTGVPGTVAKVRKIYLFVNRYLFDAHIVPDSMLGSAILQ